MVFYDIVITLGEEYEKIWAKQKPGLSTLLWFLVSHLRVRATHDAEIGGLATNKSDLLLQISDLEGEVAQLRAAASATPSAPKTNGSAQPASPGVTREELARLHEAHNLKMGDLQATHEKAMRAMQDELEKARQSIATLQADIDRKDMEINVLEQDQEESTDMITRYVRFFGFRAFVVGAGALLVVYGFF